MVEAHLAESDFERNCKRFLEKLRNAPGDKLDHSTLLKRMKMSTKVFRELADTLQERGDIGIKQEKVEGRGRNPTFYFLKNGQNRG
jgi:hypothetical protein